MNRVLFLMSLCVFALPISAANITNWSYDYKVEQDNTEYLDEQMIQFRRSCIHKAELGEQLALKKLDGTPLTKVLNNIIDSQHTAQVELPWYLILEMQRVARDAYRKDYSGTEDVDEFVLEIYHSCLNNGW